MAEKFDLNSEMDQAVKDFGLTPPQNDQSDWFKVAEGDNKVRILTALKIFPQHFNKAGYTGICLGKELNCPGCLEDDRRRELKAQDPKGNEKLQMTRNIKWMCFVLDYKDGEVKLAKLAHKIATQLQALQNNPEYAFSEAPMPYDITINAKDAGKTNVAYTTTPARQNTPIPEEIISKLEKKKSVDDIKDLIKNKKAKELGIHVESKYASENIDTSEPVEYPEEEINPDDIPF